MANELVSINSERTLTPGRRRDLADVTPEPECHSMRRSGVECPRAFHILSRLGFTTPHVSLQAARFRRPAPAEYLAALLAECICGALGENEHSKIRHSGIYNKALRYLRNLAACRRMHANAVCLHDRMLDKLVAQRGKRTSKPGPSPPLLELQSPVLEERCAVSVSAGPHTSVCGSPGPRRQAWSALL